MGMDWRQFVKLDAEGYADRFVHECDGFRFMEKLGLGSVKPSERLGVLENWYESRTRRIAEMKDNAVNNLRSAENVVGVKQVQSAINRLNDVYEHMRDSMARRYEDAKRGLALAVED